MFVNFASNKHLAIEYFLVAFFVRHFDKFCFCFLFKHKANGDEMITHTTHLLYRVCLPVNFAMALHS